MANWRRGFLGRSGPEWESGAPQSETPAPKPKPPPGAAPPEVAANEMLSKLNFCITNCNADNLC